MTLLGTWEKNAFFCFSKFWFLALWGPFFGHFRVFSSLSFVNLLYVLQVTPIDLQTWFLAQRVFMTPLRGDFNDFWKFAFLPLLGALLFSKRALKAKRHNCGHRDIISWYAGSMWQRNVGKKYYVWKFLILMSLGALWKGPRGPNGPERAKSRSFGDGNIIFGK